MLWIKSFHIVFVASWFAGLFYLPRIFVNLAMVPPESVAERERLLLMARKLMRFTTLLAVRGGIEGYGSPFMGLLGSLFFAGFLIGTRVAPASRTPQCSAREMPRDRALR